MATESGPAIDPIHQFALHPVLSILVGGHDVSLTNSGLFMLLAVALTCLLVAIGARGGSGVPGRLQAVAEMAYEFIAGMVRSAAGETGMRFFPFVFAIFFFVLLSNLIGFIPYSFTVTSQIIITAALALMVFLTVIVIGIKEHGVHFFKLSSLPACRSTYCRWSSRSRSSLSCHGQSAIQCVYSPTCSLATSHSTCSAASLSCCSAPARLSKRWPCCRS